MKIVAAAVVGLLVFCGPVLAQNGVTDPDIARLNAQAARDTAAAAATTASTARMKAQMDALGLPTAEGKTTLGTDAAMIETWMLSAATLDAAAAAIVADVAAHLRPPASVQDTTRRPGIGEAYGSGSQNAAKPTVLLLGRTEELNLDGANNLLFETDDLRGKLAEAMPQQCQQNEAVGRGEEGGAVPLAAVGALVGLLKTDTDISGMAVPLGDQLLVSAVGRKLKDRARVIIPSAAIAPPVSSRLGNAWQTLAATQAEAKACRISFAKNKQTPWVKKKLAALDAMIARVDTLDAKVTKPDDKGRIPLAQAIRYDALLESEPSVLRVHVEKAGGSVLKRSNLFTALGAPAVGITGGLIVEHNMTMPRTGDLVTSGENICRTALTNLGDVQTGTVRRRGRRGGADCTPLLR